MISIDRPDFEALERLGYSGIKEAVYSYDHPEVQEWTKWFLAETHARRIFEKFQSANPVPSLAQATVVGTQWHRFSELMPWFLCQAAATVPTNKLRHYVIQTAFEELGMRDANEIHADLFWETVKSVGVTDADRARLAACPEITESLELLRRELLRMTSAEEVLGIMLGLEIPARENIETVFSSLGFTGDRQRALAATKFFELHRQIEIEHVRMNVANFLRFCPALESRELFVRGFNIGLEFWEKYWSGVSRLIAEERLNAS